MRVRGLRRLGKLRCWFLVGDEVSRLGLYLGGWSGSWELCSENLGSGWGLGNWGVC